MTNAMHNTVELSEDSLHEIAGGRTRLEAREAFDVGELGVDGRDDGHINTNPKLVRS